MAIFKVSANNGRIELIVRAQCLSCARSVAALDSPASKKLIWRDPSQSTVQVIYNPEREGYDPKGKRGILKREYYDR